MSKKGLIQLLRTNAYVEGLSEFLVDYGYVCFRTIWNKDGKIIRRIFKNIKYSNVLIYFTLSENMKFDDSDFIKILDKESTLQFVYTPNNEETSFTSKEYITNILKDSKLFNLVEKNFLKYALKLIKLNKTK